MVPKISEEAWALLGVLCRVVEGGPAPPAGFEKALAELQSHGLATGIAITVEGYAAWRERFESSDPNLRRKP